MTFHWSALPLRHDIRWEERIHTASIIDLERFTRMNLESLAFPGLSWDFAVGVIGVAKLYAWALVNR
jgi:hypothetical protein